MARVEHDGMAGGVDSAVLAILHIDVDRPRAGELAPRAADHLLWRHVAAVGPLPNGEEPGRVVDELLSEPAIGKHQFDTLGVELDLPRPQHVRVRPADHATRSHVDAVYPPEDAQRERDPRPLHFAFASV